MSASDSVCSLFSLVPRLLFSSRTKIKPKGWAWAWQTKPKSSHFVASSSLTLSWVCWNFKSRLATGRLPKLFWFGFCFCSFFCFYFDILRLTNSNRKASADKCQQVKHILHSHLDKVSRALDSSWQTSQPRILSFSFSILYSLFSTQTGFTFTFLFSSQFVYESEFEKQCLRTWPFFSLFLCLLLVFTFSSKQWNDSEETFKPKGSSWLLCFSNRLKWWSWQHFSLSTRRFVQFASAWFNIWKNWIGVAFIFGLWFGLVHLVGATPGPNQDELHRRKAVCWFPM